MKRSMLAPMFVGVLLLPRAASAQDAAATRRAFGAKGGITVSAERLFGFDHTSSTTSSGGADSTSTSTNFSFFSSSLGGFATVFGAPRVALDGFVADHFSVGGALGYFSTSLSSAGSATSLDFSGFLIAPRAGYAAMLGASTAIWPRAGISYISIDSGNTTSSMLALSLEAPITFVVSQHVLFLVGPTFDFGLTGKRESSALGVTTSPDWKATEIGVQCSIGGSL